MNVGRFFAAIARRFPSGGSMFSGVALRIEYVCGFEQGSRCYETWCCEYRAQCSKSPDGFPVYMTADTLEEITRKVDGICFNGNVDD